MRLDKFLANMGQGTRSQVKRLIASGKVTVNDSVIKSAKAQVDANSDIISVAGQTVAYCPYIYLMLNKAKGYISSTEKGTTPTVIDCVPAEYRHYDLFPIGRLDKDTTGLLLISNDGQMAHKLLAPAKRVAKTYRVNCLQPLTGQQIEQLKSGVTIANHYQTKPAELKLLDTNIIDLTIYEGKYHQVKQMLKAVGNAVVELERIRFAGIALDGKLQRGEVRLLTADELAKLNSLQ